jgi:hypothetical protein
MTKESRYRISNLKLRASRRDRTGAQRHLHLGGELRPPPELESRLRFLHLHQLPAACLNLQHLTIRMLNVTFHLALPELILPLRENGASVIWLLRWLILRLQLRSR